MHVPAKCGVLRAHCPINNAQRKSRFLTFSIVHVAHISRCQSKCNTQCSNPAQPVFGRKGNTCATCRHMRDWLNTGYSRQNPVFSISVIECLSDVSRYQLPIRTDAHGLSESVHSLSDIISFFLSRIPHQLWRTSKRNTCVT